MAETQNPTTSVTLGPGGRITDPALLRDLEHAPVLQPRELIKLAIYFVASPTNIPLAKLLWEHALATIVTNPVISERVMQVYAINIAQDNETFFDVMEDGIAGADDPDALSVSSLTFLNAIKAAITGEHAPDASSVDSLTLLNAIKAAITGKPAPDALSVNARSLGNPDVPDYLFAQISCIGLVIEKRLLKNGEAAFLVVGVSPDPQTLPESEPPDSAPSHQ